MLIKNEIDCRLTARVTYIEGGTPTIHVAASALYDEDTEATTTVDLVVPEGFTEEIKVLLNKVFAKCAPQALHKINDAIATSRKVGQTLGEIE